MAKPAKHVFVCTQMRPPAHPKGCCSSRGAGDVMDEFRRQFEERGLWGQIGLTTSGCLGPCDLGPNMVVYPEGVMYCGVSAADVTAIIDEHLLGGQPIERLLAPADVWS